MNLYEDCTEVRAGYGEFAVSIYACYLGKQQVTKWRIYELYRNFANMIKGNLIRVRKMYNEGLGVTVTRYNSFDYKYFPIGLSDGYIRMDKETWKLQKRYCNLEYQNFGIYHVGNNRNYISTHTSNFALGAYNHIFNRSLFNCVIATNDKREFLVPRKIPLASLLATLQEANYTAISTLYLLDYNLKLYDYEFGNVNTENIPNITKAVKNSDWFAIESILKNGGVYQWK